MKTQSIELWRTQSIDACTSLNTLNDKDAVIGKERGNCQAPAVAEPVMLNLSHYIYSVQGP